MIYAICDHKTWASPIFWPYRIMDDHVKVNVTNGETNEEIARTAMRLTSEFDFIKTVIIVWNPYNTYAIPCDGRMIDSRDPNYSSRRMINVFDTNFSDPVYNWVQFINLVVLVQEYMKANGIECYMAMPHSIDLPEDLNRYQQQFIDQAPSFDLIDHSRFFQSESMTQDGWADTISGIFDG